MNKAFFAAPLPCPFLTLSLLLALAAAGCAVKPVLDDGGARAEVPDAGTADGGVPELDGGDGRGDAGALGDGGSLVADGGAVLPPILTLDLRSLYGKAPADLATRRQVYDTLVAAACIQGIVNRDRPNLYLFYKSTLGVDIDQLWLTRLSDPLVGGGVLSGRALKPAASLDAVLDAYPTAIRGLAVWDERVPATVNAAFTAAGADDLIAVRWDAAPTSLYSQLVARGLTVKVWLLNPNGTSHFLDKQGAAPVPDLTRQTSQSAKADVHVWMLEKYLQPGKLNPLELGEMLDGYWLGHPTDYAGNLQPTSQLQLTNHDWLVAKRGLSFDLSPWDDVAATDDPGQPVGSDPAILRELLSAARARAGGEVINIRGFFAWHFKYTSLEGLSAGHEPVLGEWNSVKLVSPYAAGLDADAPGEAAMANASFFAHVPLSSVPTPQRRPTPEDLVGAGHLQGLAGNGGFEDNLDGWTAHTTNRLVFTDDASTGARAHGGLRYLECNSAQLGDDLQDNLFRDGRAAQPGERITLRAFVRAPAGTVKGELVLWATGGVTESAVTAFTANGQWQEVRVALTVANANHVATRGQLYLRTANANLDVDDVAFYAGDPAAGSVEPANYVLWYVGDFDSAAWSYAFSPSVWDAPGRGVVPLAWGFSGQFASRFPPFFRHELQTRTSKDFFVGADSGPGYGNPSQMGAAARAIWANAGVRAARWLDTSTGWLLDPLAPVDEAHLQAVTPYFGDGVLLMAPAGGVSEGQVVDHSPIVALSNLDGTTVAASTSFVVGAVGPGAPSVPRFSAFRTVLPSVTNVVATSVNLVSQHPTQKFRIVDPLTFFALARRQFGGDNQHRASYPQLTLSPGKVGMAITGTVRVRNDGWETWRAGSANPYRIGLSLTPVAPRSRELPVLAGSYPTRLSLPSDLAPGDEVSLAFTLPASTTAGTHTLQVDVVEEGVTWFETQGDIPLQTPLFVVP